MWVAQYYGGSAANIIMDSAGNVYVIGISNGNRTIVKYDAGGNELWAKQYDGNSWGNYRSARVDSAGNIYVIETSDGDYITIKYDTNNGNEVWVKRYDSGGLDEAVAFAVDSMNNVYITGYSFDYNNSTYKYVTIKYSQKPLTPAAVASIINEMVSGGNITNSGLASALVSSLKNAQTLIATNPTAAKNMLEATINKIEAQSEKQISLDVAEKLIGYLNSIIDGL
ncbi:MAG: hypothetical protein HZB79_03575 [Deltaproteobacteria bacterium]|nr:hypothetical protein [Deltaproteobacteria bacterium]